MKRHDQNIMKLADAIEAVSPGWDRQALLEFSAAMIEGRREGASLWELSPPEQAAVRSAVKSFRAALAKAKGGAA